MGIRLLHLVPLGHYGDPFPVSGATLFSEDTRLLTWSYDGTARTWDLKVDYSIPIQQRILETEIKTAFELDNQGELRQQTADEQAAKRKKLD